MENYSRGCFQFALIELEMKIGSCQFRKTLELHMLLDLQTGYLCMVKVNDSHHTQSNDFNFVLWKETLFPDIFFSIQNFKFS